MHMRVDQPRRHEAALRIDGLDGIRSSARAMNAGNQRSDKTDIARAKLARYLREHHDSSVALEGAKIVPAFDREFVFVAVQGLGGRESLVLTGSAQIKESAERAAVFAVLDATNRWTELRRPR